MANWAAAILACVAAGTPPGGTLGTLDGLYATFRDPGNRYRIAVLLRTNDEVKREEIRWQVGAMKRAGCGGVFTYCERMNDGLPVEFLSDEWWDVVRWTAEACAEEGLDFWVYDEEDWPSGRAADQLVAERPDWSWHYVHVERHEFAGPARAKLEVSGDDRIGVAAYRLDAEGSVVADSCIDLSKHVRAGQLEWDVPAGAWSVAVYRRKTGPGFFTSGLADLMNGEAMAEYLDRVYEGHRAAVEGISNLHFVGYFTDEPCGSISMTAFGDKFTWFPSLPYSPELPATFERIAGASFVESLPRLHERRDPGALRLQFAFWEATAELLKENYFGQIYRFCEEHGLEATGHLMGEEEFHYHLAQNAGVLPSLYRYMHTPGIDWIHPLENRLPAVVPKYAASAAHLLGRDRAWCESFAGSGWGLTFEQMRSVVNWEHINGIGFQIPISYKYSLRGPKRATFYNPGISYQQPYWDHFKAFADYEARLCALVAGGGHVAQVVLAYPGVDIWAHAWDHDTLIRRSEEYRQLGDRLRFAGYDFDILDDEALTEDSRIDGGALVTETERFPVLILPRMDAVRRSVIERSVEFARAGGLVLAVGGLPRHSLEHGADDPALATALEQLFGTPREETMASGAGTWQPCGAGAAAWAADVDSAVALLAERLTPDVRCEPADGRLVAYHRRGDDGHLYLLMNRSDEPREYRITLSESGHPEVWDPVTGAAEAVGGYTLGNGGVTFSLAFHPQEVIPVVLRGEASRRPIRGGGEVLREIPIEGPFRFRIDPTLERPHVAWNFAEDPSAWTSVAGEIKAPETMPVGDWSDHGLEFFSGIGIYETEVDLGEVPSGARVVIDLGRVAQSAEVEVNGRPVGFVCLAPYRLDVTDAVQSGTNRLRISVANTLSNYYARFEELKDAPVHAGGDTPERRVSGLLGPVVLRVVRPSTL